MSKREIRGIRNLDWVTFSLYLSLLIVGWLMIFAVEYDGNNIRDALNSNVLSFNSAAGKQTVWIGIGLIVFFITQVIDERFWKNFAYPVFVFGLVLLIAVLIFGQEIKGAKSWFSFGGFSFQPSEFAKFGTAVALSSFLSIHNTHLGNLRSQLIAGLIFLLPVGLIMLQPDAGSALVFFSFLIVLFRAGMPMQYYVLLLLVIMLFILGLTLGPLYVTVGLGLLVSLLMILNLRRKFYWLLLFATLSVISAGAIYLGYEIQAVVAGFLLLPFLFYAHIKQRSSRLASLLATYLLLGVGFVYSINYAFDNFLKPHQQDRINVWLRPDLCDPQGSLYNVIQSKMAIGSGGLKGKGFLQGTLTKLNYVPEQSTDFIFCTVGEEQGFIGSAAIILLFVILLLRLVVIGERQKNDFSKYYAYSVAGLIFIHFFVNIGMTLGLLPIIGIPLPLISKGGSSLIGFTLLLGVLLKMDSNRFSSG
jgi:rod shape determining protein RodA